MNTWRTVKKTHYIQILGVLALDETTVEPLETATKADAAQGVAMPQPAAKNGLAPIGKTQRGHHFQCRHSEGGHVFRAAAGTVRSDIGRQDAVDGETRDWHKRGY